MLGAVDAHPRQIAAGESLLSNVERRIDFTRRRERVQCARRCEVVHHPEPAGREAEQLSKPIRHDLLELRRCGAGAPEHSIHIQRRHQELREHARRRRRVREIRHETRVIPVREPGENL
jgi:hypothetical protein